MVPEDLLFWIAPINEAPNVDPSLLCQRHADAMIVPRGWTLDDRREPIPRLFSTRPLVSRRPPAGTPRRRRAQAPDTPQPEQMQIDGTAEIERPALVGDPVRVDDDLAGPWQPDFDESDDLDGLLRVDSPLLARAFRGTDRPKR